MKDIIVVQTGGLHDSYRLQTAIAFSKVFGAYLTAVIVDELPDPVFYASDPAVGVAPIEGDLRDEAEAKARLLQHDIDEKLKEAGIPARSVIVTDTRNRIGSGVCQYALLSDLMIASIPASSTKSELMKAVIDNVLINATCGILCLPHRPAGGTEFKHALISWNGSREAARALTAALPILERVPLVTVLLMDQPLRQAGEAVQHDVMRRLENHGIIAKLTNVTSKGMSRAEAIIEESKRADSDLLIMGGQAEGGLRQWFQDSVSRKVLADADIALLIAH